MYEQRTSKTGGATEHVFYISNGARAVAQVTQVTQTVGTSTDVVQYLHDDHLGSAQLISDSHGTVLEERSYDAFGQSRNPENWAQLTGTGAGTATSGITDGFTGHERDAEFGLVNMRGREYDPRIGQFLQADPIVQDPSNSQYLNRYAYVLNNPLKLVDPSGYDDEPAPDSSLPSAPAGGAFDDDVKAPAGTPPAGDGSAGLHQLTGENWTSTQSATAAAEGQPSGSAGHSVAICILSVGAHVPRSF